MNNSVEKNLDPDGSKVIYKEKLRPTWAMWLMVLIAAALGWLTLAPLSTWGGVISGLVVALIAVFGLRSSFSDITVTNNTLQVGRATISRVHLGTVTGYRGDDAFAQRGPKLHGLAYLHLRSWIKSVVRIQIEDPKDRTPYWLTSSNRPEELVAALGGTMHTVEQEEIADEDIPEWLIEAERRKLENES